MGTALFLLGAFSLQSLVEAGGGKTFTSPSIVVDLDLPASQRWDAAMQYYGAAGPQAIKAYFSSYDNRRKYVLQGMAAIGSPAKATKASLLKVISTKPVENEHTSYQTVMNPSLGTFDVYTHLKP